MKKSCRVFWQDGIWKGSPGACVSSRRRGDITSRSSGISPTERWILLKTHLRKQVRLSWRSERDLNSRALFYTPTPLAGAPSASWVHHSRSNAERRIWRRVWIRTGALLRPVFKTGSLNRSDISESLSSIILPCRALFVKINLSNFLVPAAARLPKQQAHQQGPRPGVPAERQISGACQQERAAEHADAPLAQIAARSGSSVRSTARSSRPPSSG